MSARLLIRLSSCPCWRSVFRFSGFDHLHPFCQQRKSKSQQAKSLHSRRQHPGRLEKLPVLSLAWMKERHFTGSLVRPKVIFFIFVCLFVCLFVCFFCFFSSLLPLWSCTFRFLSLALRCKGTVNKVGAVRASAPCQRWGPPDSYSRPLVTGQPFVPQALGGKEFLDPTLNSKWNTVSRFAKAHPLVLTFDFLNMKGCSCTSSSAATCCLSSGLPATAMRAPLQFSY